MLRALQKLYEADDANSGSHIEDVVDTPETPDEPQPPAMSLEDMEAALKAAGRFPTPQVTQPSRTLGDVEMIEGTNFPKPDGFDSWSIDKTSAYIAQQTMQATMGAMHQASAARREAEKAADPWYKDEYARVLEDCNPNFLAQATQDDFRQLQQMAKGMAIDNGKSPNTSKPVPGASPANNRPQNNSTVPSEVDAELANIRSAGYGVVADDPKIRELLSA